MSYIGKATAQTELDMNLAVACTFQRPLISTLKRRSNTRYWWSSLCWASCGVRHQQRAEKQERIPESSCKRKTYRILIWVCKFRRGLTNLVGAKDMDNDEDMSHDNTPHRMAQLHCKTILGCCCCFKSELDFSDKADGQSLCICKWVQLEMTIKSHKNLYKRPKQALMAREQSWDLRTWGRRSICIDQSWAGRTLLIIWPPVFDP